MLDNAYDVNPDLKDGVRESFTYSVPIPEHVRVQMPDMSKSWVHDTPSARFMDALKYSWELIKILLNPSRLLSLVEKASRLDKVRAENIRLTEYALELDESNTEALYRLEEMHRRAQKAEGLCAKSINKAFFERFEERGKTIHRLQQENHTIENTSRTHLKWAIEQLNINREFLKESEKYREPEVK